LQPDTPDLGQRSPAVTRNSGSSPGRPGTATRAGSYGSSVVGDWSRAAGVFSELSASQATGPIMMAVPSSR